MSIPTSKDLYIMETWSSLINRLIHDLKNSFSGLHLMSHGLSKIFPDLIKGYRAAIKHQLIIPSAQERYIKGMEQAPVGGLLERLVSIDQMLNHLKMNIQKLFDQKENLKIFSIKNYIENNVVHFNNSSIIHLKNIDDFDFLCTDYFLCEIFKLSLKKLLETIETMKNGTIEIWTERTTECNSVFLRENSKSIHFYPFPSFFDWWDIKKDKPHEPFCPGIGFCKLFLLSLGGDITFSHTVHEHSTLMIRFATV